MPISDSNAQLVSDLFSIVGRFWSKVAFADGDSCWEWTGGIVHGSGYGLFHVVEGKPMLAHRFAYILSRGYIPDGLLLLHSCDNRKCVRPDHLTPGTQQANMDDMWEKGRGARGERNGAHLHPDRVPRGERQGGAKLTDEQVILMRQRSATEQVGLDALATEFGVSRTAVSKIVTGRTWTHVGGPTRAVRAAGDKLVNHTGDKHWTRRRPELVKHGEDNGNSRLTVAQAIEIRTRHAAGERQEALAAEFDISKGSVSNLVTGKTWADVGGPVRASRASKLGVEQVREIRRRLAGGERGTTLAAEFGVTPSTVSLIKQGRVGVYAAVAAEEEPSAST